jgi:hypothetical protein
MLPRSRISAIAIGHAEATTLIRFAAVAHRGNRAATIIDTP